VFSSVSPYIYSISAFLLAALISLFCVGRTIKVATKRMIYDVPDDIRKIHGGSIPTLGGAGIFIGFVLVSLFFLPGDWYKFVLIATTLLFFTGIYDDLMNMSPIKKLAIQLVASFICSACAPARLADLYGFAGVGALAFWPSVLLSTVACTFFINVFNFIDGIDGLACSLGIFYCLVLGALFILNGNHPLAAIVFTLAGAAVGLLRYNLAPAKIYMGDTGSMFIGLILFVMAILFLDTYGLGDSGIQPFLHSNQAAALFILALLFLPIFDGLRVFIVRASQGISPLKADRRHLHYILIDAGLSHSAAVMFLLSSTIAMLLYAWATQDNAYLCAGGIVVLGFATLFMAAFMKKKRPAVG
jgi:UDP-GlcNAc:undecaprenyl-phosphate/decaprenyl-phosphate GlcNAc-1-phosphate transferase